MKPKTKFPEIAEAIERHAETLPDTEDTQGLRAEVRIGPTVIRFPASKAAALAVAQKYRTGKTALRPSWTPPRLPSLSTSRFCQDTLDAFIADDEIDNAKQYARLHGRELCYFLEPHSGSRKPLRKATVMKIDPRFAVGQRSPGKWSVTHLASGREATVGHTRAEALERFAEIDRARLEAAIAFHHDNGADRPAHPVSAA